MVKTRVSSKGQTTIPLEFRQRWRTSRVIWSLNADGSASVRPAPDIMTLFGRGGSQQPKDPCENEAAERSVAEDGDSSP